MQNITVIILTKNEEKNIEKCINSAKQIASRILVIDSGSDDKTVELAKKLGAEVFYHKWLGHAAQFNWALDNCMINTEWVFRLDADEIITKKLANEIYEELQKEKSKKINAYAIRWNMYFMGRRLKHGGNGKTYIIRLFRYGKGRVEEKAMDERFVVEGIVKNLREPFLHYDYKGLDSWLEKHLKYSLLELNLYKETNGIVDKKVNKRQKQRRGIYYSMPLFLRARLYYWYRYYLQLGFLDGREGKIFIYLQAYWYRYIVDAKIYEMEHKKE